MLNGDCPSDEKLLLNKGAPPVRFGNAPVVFVDDGKTEKLGRGTGDENEGVVEGSAIEALNGFAPPVICGRKPPPGEPEERGELLSPLPFRPNGGLPVNCALRAPNTGLWGLGLPVVVRKGREVEVMGLAGLDDAPVIFAENPLILEKPVKPANGDFAVGEALIGGKDSSKLAPNDDDGLKGLMPPKPVGCG